MSIEDKMLAYEQNNMEEQEMIEFFQELLDTGLAWELQGHYGRATQALLDLGYIKLKV